MEGREVDGRREAKASPGGTGSVSGRVGAWVVETPFAQPLGERNHQLIKDDV